MIVNILKVLIAFILRPFFKNKYKQYFLISERGIDARDNGFVFFQYLIKNKDNIHPVYCISKKSSDFKKVVSTGEYVQFNSIKHILIFINAKALISTHVHFGAPTFRGFNFALNHIFKKIPGKKIFLQHGIIKDWLPSLAETNFHPDLFICGAKPEYDYVLATFGHDKNIVKYTGLARYDLLCTNGDIDSSHYILYMPTWREKYRNISNKEFLSTDYYKEIMQVLNSHMIEQILISRNIKLIFYPHIEIQKFINTFSTTSKQIIIADFDNFDIQLLIRNCDILITDYSSVFFDAAYMLKPIIFFQYDYNEYRKNHYKEGYFDYKKSFGKVVSSISELENLLKNDETYKLSVSQLNQIKSFFVYRDKNNCDRIYYEIQRILGEKYETTKN